MTYSSYSYFIDLKINVQKFGVFCVLGFGITTLYNVIINNKINKLCIDSGKKNDILLQKINELNNKIQFLNYEKELLFEKTHFYNEKNIETIKIANNVDVYHDVYYDDDHVDDEIYELLKG